MSSIVQECSTLRIAHWLIYGRAQDQFIITVMFPFHALGQDYCSVITSSFVRQAIINEP